jgi:hypothetical protein
MEIQLNHLKEAIKRMRGAYIFRSGGDSYRSSFNDASKEIAQLRKAFFTMTFRVGVE